MSNPPGGCADFHRSLPVDRRSFLKAGILGTAGLSLAEFLRAEAQAGAGTSTTSVIILWMRGGPSDIDMWDPKPNAPAELSRRIRRPVDARAGNRSVRPAAPVRADHAQVVHCPQPLPWRRRSFQRRPDLFHRLSRRPESG